MYQRRRATFFSTWASLLVMSSACLSCDGALLDRVCADEGDCFRDEVCASGQCETNVVLDTTRPFDDAPIDGLDSLRYSEYLLYSETRGPLVLTHKERALTLTSWQGGRWVTTVALDAAIEDGSIAQPVLHDDRIRIVYIHPDTSIRELSEGPSGWDEVEVMGPNPDADQYIRHYAALSGSATRALCVFRGDGTTWIQDPTAPITLKVAATRGGAGWREVISEEGTFSAACNVTLDRNTDSVDVWANLTRDPFSELHKASYALGFDIYTPFAGRDLMAQVYLDTFVEDAGGDRLMAHNPNILSRTLYLSKAIEGGLWRTVPVFDVGDEVAVTDVRVYPNGSRPDAGVLTAELFNLQNNQVVDRVAYGWEGSQVFPVTFPLDDDESGFAATRRDDQGFWHVIYTLSGDPNLYYARR